MFATGQEWRFLLFCVQSAEEVWNANFMRIKAAKEKSSWGSAEWEEDSKTEKEWVQRLRKERAGKVF